MVAHPPWRALVCAWRRAGTRSLSREEIEEAYPGGPPVDLRESRWVFLNTLFSVSEGCLYAQLVDKLDSGTLLADCKEPFDAARCSTYEQLYSAVSKALFKAHVQSSMKAEVRWNAACIPSTGGLEGACLLGGIGPVLLAWALLRPSRALVRRTQVMQEPLKYVKVDADFSRTLLDQRAAGVRHPREAAPSARGRLSVMQSVGAEPLVVLAWVGWVGEGGYARKHWIGLLVPSRVARAPSATRQARSSH